MQLTTLTSLVVAAVAGRAAAYTGDLTYYYPGGGYGACGQPIQNGDLVAAVSARFFTAANPNQDPICGRTVTVTYNGRSATARVLDKCGGCGAQDIDVTPAVFSQLADLSAGRVRVNWSGV